MQVSSLRGKKIAFVAGTLGQGGAERQLYYILRALKDCGADPTLFSLTRGEFWEEPIRRLGVRVVWFGQQRSVPARLCALAAHLRRLRPDVVQSQHFYTNPYVALGALAAGAPGIGAMRNDGRHEVGAHGSLMGAACLKWPRTLAANSRAALRYAEERGVPPHRLFLLQNVIDTERFVPTSRSGREVVTLLAAGRLTDQKRLDRFLDLMARVRSALGSAVRGVVAGAGPLEAELKASAANLSLADTVRFLGAVEDMVPVFERADVFVLTSDWEGTPNVLLEAMSSGLACVATRVGGVADMSAAPGVEFFEPDDLPGMAARLTQLASTPRLREELGRGNRDHVVETYSTDVLPDHLGALYAAVYPKGRRRA